LEGITLAIISATGIKEEAKANSRKNLNVEETREAWTQWAVF
jgi:hypothetical protein